MSSRFLKILDKYLGLSLLFFFPRANPKVVPKNIKRILLIRPGGIGDAVLLIPSIICLKNKYPDAEINILAESRNVQTFSLCSEVDHVYCYDRLTDFYRFTKKRYDVVIDTEQWHRLSAIVARLLRSQVKIGYGTNSRRKLFTHVLEYSHETYERDSFFDLLRPLDVEPSEQLSSPFLKIPQVVQDCAYKLPETIGRQPFVVLFPGASISERRWGTERFTLLADRLRLLGRTLVVVGGPDDVVAGDEITLRVPGVINLAGKTSLLQTAAILKDAVLLVSGDSGILHIAVGLDIPTVSLFGPGIASKWAPRGEKHVVINHQLSCSPCTKFGTTPPCPIRAKCITDISVDEVFNAVQFLLSKGH